jgi:hypothetical protein
MKYSGITSFIIGSIAQISAVFGATIFDSNTVDPATTGNYWPWGDNRNTRYQLWFSQSSLSAFSGTIATITHYAENGDPGNLGTSTYTLNIYASTTPATIAGLSSANPESNHGADKTLVFSGTITSAPTLVIDISDVFLFNNSGNLLLDYQFSSFTGVGASYDGPTFQASNSGGSSSDFARVTAHASEGAGVYTWGAIRTQLEFIPEPSSSLLCVVGTTGLLLRRRR